MGHSVHTCQGNSLRHCPLLHISDPAKEALYTSRKFPKLILSLLILLLSIGCPLIHEYSTNLLLCATTASTWPFLDTWLNSLKFTNQPKTYALLLILSFFIFPLCMRNCLVRELFLMLHHLSGTVSVAKLGHQTCSYLSNHLWNLTYSGYPTDSDTRQELGKAGKHWHIRLDQSPHKNWLFPHKLYKCIYSIKMVDSWYLTPNHL